MDSVVVTWTAGLGAASHVVTLTPTGSEPVTQAVDAPVTTATFTGLAAGTEYTAAVTALAADGTPAPAERTATVTTPSAVAPGAVSVTRATSGHEAIALEWTASAPGNAASPVTGYELVATRVDATGVQIGDPATVAVGAVTAGAITGLTDTTAYRVQVFAKSGTLLSGPSTNGNGVAATVTPRDVVSFGRAAYRPDRTEWRVQGGAQDTTANSVTIYVWTVNAANPQGACGASGSAPPTSSRTAPARSASGTPTCRPRRTTRSRPCRPRTGGR